MSGGRATVGARKFGHKALASHAGDITATHPRGQFLLDLFIAECKFYETIHYDRLTYGKDAILKAIWFPTAKAALRADLDPLVIVRENRREEMILTSPRGMRYLQAACTQPLTVCSTFPPYGIEVCRLGQFVLRCEPDRLRSISSSVKLQRGDDSPEPVPQPRRRLFAKNKRRVRLFTGV